MLLPTEEKARSEESGQAGALNRATEGWLGLKRTRPSANYSRAQVRNKKETNRFVLSGIG
jgi:hypothetical protein